MAGLIIDLRIAFMNLVEHGRRTALLGTAIASVTCLFVLLTSLSIGIRQAMIESATTLMTGHLNVGGFFKVTAAQAIPAVTEYEALVELVRRTLPEAASIVQRGRGGGKIISDTGSSMPAAISGIDIQHEPDFKRVLEVVSGDIGQLARPNTLLLFEQQAKKLDVKLGDAVTITAATTRGVANTIDCRVVAIAREIGLLSSYSVYISNASLRDLYQLRPDVTGALHIRLKPEHVADVDRLAARLRGALGRAGYRLMQPDPRVYFIKLQSVTHEDWSGQKLDVTTWEDELSFIMWTLRTLQAVNFVLLLILLLIIVAGIMNTLWIAIRERTREIGTLRAIGMQRSAVARLFLLEAALLGLFGASSGVALGVVAMTLINAGNLRVPVSVQLFVMRSKLQLALESSTVLWAILLFTLVAGVAALYPALRAARRKPVDAMAHFG